MRIACIDSWITTSHAGSGMAVAIDGLRRGLQGRGPEVVLVSETRQALFLSDTAAFLFGYEVHRIASIRDF